MAITALCYPTFGQTTAEEWFTKGFILQNLSKYVEAIQAFNEAIELNPKCLDAWVGKGFALHALSYDTEAQDALDKAIQIDRKNATDLFSQYSKNLSFRKKVSLKEGCGCKKTSGIQPGNVRKTVVERFAELNKIKKNVTK